MILFSVIEKMRLFPLSLKNLNCVLFLKALKTEKGPMGLPGMEHRGLFCHLFLVRLWPLWPSLSSKGQIQTVALSREELPRNHLRQD